MENNSISFYGVSLSDLPDVAKAILNTSVHAVNLLQAPMGSGKTTLCNELLKQWGSDSAGSSPTFSLIQEHNGPQGTLFHVDAYRINHEQEAYDIGFEEYIESGHPMWIEWAERVESFLPYRVGVVYIRWESENSRNIEFLPDVVVSEIQRNHE
tara:strand:+ start:982 stop:1443 length:462 start_codon:yes stop_codon:yes gene_type:complete